MIKITTNLDTWPTTKAGYPIFTCTEDANFHANLIFDDEKRIKRIRRAMENARQDLRALRKKPTKNLDKMMLLATRAQFYRECLEEIDRIHNDKFFT